MKQNDLVMYLQKYMSFLACLVFAGLSAQELYIDDGGQLYLSAGAVFTTSNTIVTHHTNGVFAVAAGFNGWASASNTEHVNGTVRVLGAGSGTVASVGDGTNYSPITLTTSGVTPPPQIDCAYTQTDPASGRNETLYGLGPNNVLSDTEYWTVTETSGSATTVTVNEAAAALYAGNLAVGATTLVRWTSTDWSSTTTGNGILSLTADQTALSTEEAIFSDFAFYPNPVKATASQLHFKLPSSVIQLDITLYDVLGKIVQQYRDLPIQTGENSIDKPKLSQGLYLLKFSFNNGEHQLTKRVIIQ